MNEKNANSSDASTGQTIVTRVLARKAELEQVLASAGENTRTQNDISTALNTVNALLSGDLENVPHVVVADMNRWLENNKHLAETAPVAQEVQPDSTNVLSIATGLPVDSSTDPWRPNS